MCDELLRQITTLKIERDAARSDSDTLANALHTCINDGPTEEVDRAIVEHKKLRASYA